MGTAQRVNLSRHLLPYEVLLSNTALLVYLALVNFFTHWLTSSRYGFHRDEFYYIANGRHLDWGYVDHPPMIALIARTSELIFGESLAGYRFFAGVAGAIAVLLVGLMARALGGGRFAQILAALAALVAPFFAGASSMLGTVAFDHLVWVSVLYLLVLLFKTEEKRLWLIIGVFFGIGLLTKYIIVFCALGMVVGLLLTPNRAYFKTRYLWMAGLIALLIFLPNLMWQIDHDFATLEFSRNSNEDTRAEDSLAEFIIMQFVIPGLPAVPLCLAGLYFYFSAAGVRFRAMGWIFVVAVVTVGAMRGKFYYVGSAYAILLAGGAVMAEKWLHNRPRLRTGIVAVSVVISLPFVALFVPLLPEKQFLDAEIYAIYEEFGEMYGWNELVAAVAQTYASLTPEEQAKTGILAANYGEAGAINFYRDDYDLPEAISPHNSYYWWGPGEDQAIYIIVGYQYPSFCLDVEKSPEVVSNPYAIENDEYGGSIFICRKLSQPMSQLWSDLKNYN